MPLIVLIGAITYGIFSLYVAHYRLILTPLEAQHKAKFYLQPLTTTFGGANVAIVWTDIGGQWHRDYEVQWLDIPHSGPIVHLFDVYVNGQTGTVQKIFMQIPFVPISRIQTP